MVLCAARRQVSYEKDGHELDASVYWWHRELKEKGFYDPADFEQGIQNYHADDGGINLNSVTHSLLFGQQNILTIGFPIVHQRQWVSSPQAASAPAPDPSWLD